jgi:DNA-binding MarR family transcriptional regulator
MSNSPTEKPLDIEVLKQFRVIFKSIGRHFQSIERTCGISGAQLWALAKIDEIPDITISRLAEELAIHQTTASNLVDKLASKELVSKVRQKADQRFVSLALASEGRQVLAKAPTPLQGLLPDALGKMPYKKLVALYGLLDDLKMLMEHIEEDAGAAPLGKPILLAMPEGST